MSRIYDVVKLLNIEAVEHSNASLNDIMQSRMYLAVTEPSYEALLIVALVALDLAEIVTRGYSTRMNALWQTIATSSHGVPIHLHFRVGPKIEEHGLQWQPQSLLTI